MFAIPFDNSLEDFQEQIELDGNTYVLGFLWNTRDLAWYMSLGGVDGSAIVDGIKLVLGVELLQWTRVPGLPPGQVFAVSSDPEKLVIGRDDIPGAVSLIYVPEAEA